MTPLANVSAALHVTLGLTLVWILLFRLFRDYRIDALRDRLFALRDELFDYAADGNVAFVDPAYTKLRGLINSLIRYAHRLTFTRFFMGVLFMSLHDEACDREPLEAWYRAVDALPASSQGELKRIHSEMLVLVVRHLVTGSPVMLAGLSMFSIWAILNGLAKRLLEAFTDRLPGLELLQVQAIAADAAERQAMARQPEEAFAHH